MSYNNLKQIKSRKMTMGSFLRLYFSYLKNVKFKKIEFLMFLVLSYKSIMKKFMICLTPLFINLTIITC